MIDGCQENAINRAALSVEGRRRDTKECWGRRGGGMFSEAEDDRVLVKRDETRWSTIAWWWIGRTSKLTEHEARTWVE